MGMLVLTFKPGKSCYLTLENGDVIRFKHLRSHGRGSKYGIEAPRSVRIEREELLTRPRKTG